MISKPPYQLPAVIVHPLKLQVVEPAQETYGAANRDATTLRGFYSGYYLPLRLRNKSESQKRLYETLFRNLRLFFRRDLMLLELSDDLVSRYMAWHLDRGRSPATANREMVMILAVWRFACHKGFLHEWPDVEPFVVPHRIPRAWSEEELKRLFAAIATTPGRIGAIPARLWWHALHVVGWDTGERIGALLAIRWEWVSLGEPTRLLVSAEARKGKRADRSYLLHSETADALRRIAMPVRELVFEFPIKRNSIYYAYGKIKARAGLPVGPQFNFHCLRKTVASFGKLAGLDPQELMGHADARVTQRYLDPRICGQKSAAETLFRPDRNGT
jgi:integrase